jgi:ABC-2 type transport system ATP-binding protein
LADVIAVEGLCKRYGDRVVLQSMSFTAPAGRVTGFLGPNGAGKTTTFRCTLGLATPSAGTATINGRSYSSLSDPRREVGAVLESTGFHPARSGRDHLRVIACAAGFARSRVDEVLEVVGLTAAAGRRVGGYSLGMRQRLGIASALLGDPGVLILDEPTNGLDPEGVSWLRALTRHWASEGRAVLVSSHLLAEIVQTVDRVVIIADGQMITETDLDTLTASASVITVDDARPLVAELTRRSVAFDLSGDTVRTGDMSAAELGQIAVAAGATIRSLGAADAASELERRFLALTNGSIT